jgi:hypothetical protein
VSNFQLIVFGGLIIFFLIVEPHGLARLWQIAKEKLRLWPFRLTFMNKATARPDPAIPVLAVPRYSSAPRRSLGLLATLS